MPRISASKVKSYWKKYGTLALAKRVLLRIWYFVFYTQRLDFYCICGAPQTQLYAKCPLEIRKGGPEDMDMFVEISVISSGNWDRAVIRKEAQRLLDNGELFLGFSEGELAATGWLHYCAGMRVVHSHIEIGEDEAYIGFCQTHPKFRGKGIYPVLLQYIMRYVADKGKKKCLGSADYKNIPSIKGVKKAGFTFVGKNRKFKLFGKFFNSQWSSSKAIVVN